MSSLNPNAIDFKPGTNKPELSVNPGPEMMQHPGGGYNMNMGGGGGPRNNPRSMFRPANNMQQPPPNMGPGPQQGRRPPPGSYNQGGGNRQYGPPPPQAGGGYYSGGQDRGNNGNYFMDNNAQGFYPNPPPPQPISPYLGNNNNNNYLPPPPPQQQQPMPPYQRQPSPQVQQPMNMPPNRRTPVPATMAQYQTPPQAPTYFARNKVTIILVVGYQSSGKTTVAKALAAELRFPYISLKFKEDAEGYEEGGINLAALAEMIKTPNLQGLIIDDGLVNNKYEPYYINDILRKANLNLDVLCVVNNDLSDLINRGVNFDLELTKQAHPESFEFAEQLECENSAQPGGSPIAVVDGSQPINTVIESAISQVREVMSKGLPPLKLPAVNFIPNCPLVEDYKLAKEIIEAEFASLQVDKNEFGIPFAEPNYVLDYVVFVRKALLFQEYMLVPWVWGDKVSLIAYGDNVYVHLPSYKLLFHLQEVPTPVLELVQQLKGEMERGANAAAPDEGAEAPAASPPVPGGPKILFSLEATMLENVLYISDMMRIGKNLGSEMTLHERINKMQATLGKLPDPTGAGPLRCLRFYPVCQITDCLRENPFARGALFINPDGMRPGKYDSRNYIYPCADVQTAQIRLWNGRMEDNGDWVFDALARNGDTEVPLMTQNGEEQLISVYIPDDVVSTYTINDGNIIECSLKEESNAVAAKGGNPNAKKGNKGPSTTTFAFEKRCTWKTSTSTDYHQYAFIYPMAWSLDSFYQACQSVKHVTPSAEV